MLKQLAIPSVAALMALSASAQERGAPVFQDAFDTKDTFAENWVVAKGWSGRVLPADGQVHFPQGGELLMRRDTPAEFCAEMDVTLNPPADGGIPKDGFCGFIIEGFRFTLTHQGRYWVASSPKESGGTGLAGPVEGFQFGKPVAVSLVRKAEPGAAKYVFRVNGKEAATRVFNLKQQADGTYEPLRIFSYKVDMSIDNFGLFAVKGGADESPDLVINSGFEHELDGFPPYYTTPSFNIQTITNIPYETFLDSASLDEREKHSGSFSLKLVNDGRTSGGAQSIRPWGVGTVTGGAGVFSVWMKADRTNFPVSLRYGGTHGNWKAYLQLNRELLALTDVLTTEEETASASATGDPGLLRHITKLHDGHLHVIACNIDAQDAGDVTFTLPPGLRTADEAEVLFEDRKVAVENGRFIDAFPGHERHVYRIRLAGAK